MGFTVIQCKPLLLTVFCFCCVADQGRADASRDAAGGEVVLRTLARARDAGLITSHETDLLRRIAYVETRDGLAMLPNSTNGGMWAVDRSLFRRTQSPGANTTILSIRSEIEKVFGRVWVEVRWSDMTDPLHSALAAHLVLALAPTSPPPSGDLIDQAAFWREHYHLGGSEENFVRAAKNLQGRTPALQVHVSERRAKHNKAHVSERGTSQFIFSIWHC